MDMRNIVNPMLELFEGSFPNTRTTEGAELKAKVVADIGVRKKLPFRYINLEPSLDKGNFRRLQNLRKLLMGTKRKNTCIIREGCHSQLGHKVWLQGRGEIMDIPGIHALHGLDAGMSVKSDRIVYQLSTFYKSSLAWVRTGLQCRANRMASQRLFCCP